MLVRRTGRRVFSEMISLSDNRFLSPDLTEKNHSFLHIPLSHKLARIHQFHALKPTLKGLEFPINKAVVRSRKYVSVERTPRFAVTDAQAALFDYLHCTRGYGFLDAEHISKNSPQFLQELITRVERDQDVSRALLKFFRYHPINEFEPFFESLGLRQTEYTPLLPRGLIFLSDDQVLLDNYHALCNYGIPRINIGRMCKEADEILRFEHGVLDMKLRTFEQLGLCRSTVIKLVSCSPVLLLGNDNNAFIGTIEKLKALGFEEDWIGGYLSSKNKYNWNRFLDTMCFLSEVGYGDAQLGVLLSENTYLLVEGSGKQVYVFVGALLKLGLNMNEVYALFLKNPQMLSRKRAKNFWKVLHFLFEIGMEPENISLILSKHMKLLGSQSLKGPKTVLRIFDGDKYTLCQTLREDPSTFFNYALKSKIPSAEQVSARNPNNYFEKKDFLLRIGYAENSDEMVKALKRFRGRGDQLQERFDCLVQAGLDFNAVSSMVKQAPTLLNQTKDVLEKKINCLKNYLGYPVDSIVTFPSYLCYDMERIIMRFSMYAWLREKGAAKPTLSVGTLLASSEARFVKYFVIVHPEGPCMWENLKKSLASS
ncbi:transcription termination factor MTEF18, mitochondrial-like [Primulina tabacum]|uniref:transcription termination factor MTEF18, mitochondrial-like n=1 Tax=Primulina tabacum TaxID=48773 RepID=UPI003F5A307F